MIEDLRGLPFYVFPNLPPNTLKMKDGNIVTDSVETVRTEIARWNTENAIDH